MPHNEAAMIPARWSTNERRLAQASFVAVTVLIGSFLLQGASSLVASAHRELIGHVGASAGFTVAASGMWLLIGGQRPSLQTILHVGVAVTIAAELAQMLSPTRVVQLKDIAMGMAGVLIAGLVSDAVLSRNPPRRSLGIHASATGIASAVLFAMLVLA